MFFLNFIYLLLISCNEKVEDKKLQTCTITIDQLKNELVNSEKVKMKNIDTFFVYDERINGKTGGVYTFNLSKILIDYRFFEDSNSFNYIEKFGNNQFINQGSPIVRYELNDDSKGNSNLYIDYFLLNKKIDNLKLSLNGEEINLEIMKSKSFKNMYYSATHLKNIQNKNLKSQNLILKGQITYCNGSIQKITDTISNFSL